MTVEEFCLQKTQKGEMCVFMVNGRIVGTAWIDPDNLFMTHPAIGKKKFDSDFWSRLSIVTEHGDVLDIPCHYICYTEE